MTIVRVGTTKKYAAGWDAAFGKAPSKKKDDAAKKKPEASAKKAAPKKGKK